MSSDNPSLILIPDRECYNVTNMRLMTENVTNMRLAALDSAPHCQEQGGSQCRSSLLMTNMTPESS